MPNHKLPSLAKSLGLQMVEWYDQISARMPDELHTLDALSGNLGFPPASPSKPTKEDNALRARIAWEPAALTLMIDWIREFLVACSLPMSAGELTLSVGDQTLSHFFFVEKRGAQWVPSEHFDDAHRPFRTRAGFDETPLNKQLVALACEWFVEKLVQAPLHVRFNDRTVELKVVANQRFARFERPAGSVSPGDPVKGELVIKPLFVPPTTAQPHTNTPGTTNAFPSTQHSN